MLNYVFSPLKELDYKLLEISEGPANTPFHLQWVQSITILAFGQGVPVSAKQSAVPSMGRRPSLLPTVLPPDLQHVA